MSDPDQPMMPGRNGGRLRRGGGNPSGSTLSITEELKRQLLKDKAIEQAARSLLIQFMKGNPAAIKQVLDRIDGPVTEKHDVATEIRVVYEDDPPAEIASGADEDRPLDG